MIISLLNTFEMFKNPEDERAAETRETPVAGD